MAQEYDTIKKHLFSDYATEISQFILGIKNIQVIDNIDTEQQIVIGGRAKQHHAYTHLFLGVNSYVTRISIKNT